VCGTHNIAVSAIIIAGVLYAVDNVGTFPPVGTHSPHSIAAVRTLNNACKDVLKAALVFGQSAACNKLLYGVKLLLRDYPLMGVGYHFPFFGQLRGAFLAFHVGGNPLVACKVSRIYRAS
jgi:hypothetical protein